MNRFVYRDVLEEKMVPHADNNMPFFLDILTRQRPETHV